MSKVNRKIINDIKEKFDYGYYQKYLDGDITRYELCNFIKCNDYQLGLILKELDLKTRYQYLHDNTNHNFFNNIDKEEKSYILGLYLADGCITYPNRISFSQTEKDKELIYIVRKFLCPCCNIIITKEKKIFNGKYIMNPMYRIHICSSEIHNTLESYGIGERKTYFCDTDLSFIPKDQMIHFIRGYFDGDGTISLTKGTKSDGYKFENVTCRITSYKKDHLLIIHDFLLNEYNIHSNIIKERRGNYIISIDRKKDFILLRDLLYKNATLYLKRKRDKFFDVSFDMIPLKRKVKLVNISTNEEKIYESLTSISKVFNVSVTSIRNWMKNKKIINGYKIVEG